MATKGQKFQKYDHSLKEIIVNQHMKEHRSYGQLAEKYGIPIGTINTWVYQYRKRGKLTNDKAGRPVSSTELDYKEKYEILKKFMVFCEKVDRKKK
ncbi:MAG: helix-turn-helix domain-containing protein [Candidatus Izemoplasmatales bacterium]|jgi:transposase|nr:helix-turn-helix domain-containing protein [Candidatus Izemoplasmatales bacterium]